jgi:hypothetical protein
MLALTALFSSASLELPLLFVRKILLVEKACTDIYIPYIVYKYPCEPHQQIWPALTAKGILRPVPGASSALPQVCG